MTEDCAPKSVRKALPCGLVLQLAASRAVVDAGRPRVAILQYRLVLLEWLVRPFTRVQWPCILKRQESELCRDPGGRFLYVMSDQNSVQRSVILAKRNSMGTIPCHLTALAQVFKTDVKEPRATPNKCISAEEGQVVTRTLHDSTAG